MTEKNKAYSKAKRKNAWILGISYLLALFIALCGFIIHGYSRSAAYSALLQNSYSSSLTDLSQYMTVVSDSLEKELYCNSNEQFSSLSADILKNSACAKHCLENLPVSPNYTASVYKFLSQAGDYSASIVKSGEISNESRANLKKLSAYSAELTQKINDLQATACDNDNCTYWANELDSMFAPIKNSDELSALNLSAQDISQSETNYPKLIYDGPFSDHLLQGKAKFIDTDSLISASAAKYNAAEYSSCSDKDIVYKTTDDANVKCYVYGKKDTDYLNVYVTQKGGKLMQMTKERTVKERKIDKDEAVIRAKKYLKDVYKEDFCESYYVIDNNICVINFAFCENSVIMYPDLIKVGVAMDNGEILSVEAAGYIMNHHNRSLHFTKTIEEAKAKVSRYLKVKSAAKCVINLGTDKDYVCYEFTCKGEKNEDILVYIDALDLTERNIMILQKTDGGVLTR